MGDILHLLDSGRTRCVVVSEAPSSPANASFSSDRLNRDDLPRTSGNGTEQRREAETSHADHRRRRSSRQSRRVEYRTDPVRTAQPKSAAWSNGSSGSIFTADLWETVAYSAKAETPR
jgi:hypothetical protein